MLSKRSIRREYAKQLVFASLALIVVFSLILFGYIRSSIFEGIKDELIANAEYINASESEYLVGTRIEAFSMGTFRSGEITVTLIPEYHDGDLQVLRYYDEERHYFELRYPYNKTPNTVIQIIRDVSETQDLVDKILDSILIINFGALVLVQIYAFALSKILTKPVRALSRKLSKMNENMLEPFANEQLPVEFRPLGESFNSLIEKLQTYVNYQKELFVGVAHELKTPLAVMKLKNEVVLIKDRDKEKYIEAVKLNIQSVNEMNELIGSVLEIGRQEGAQFESPREVDIIGLLKNISDDFSLLAKEENKHFIIELEPSFLVVMIQPTLLKQVIRNFLQNAIKFTPPEKSVLIKSRLLNDELFIEVIDEGPGIDGNIDIFAPFKRSGNKSGTGLGLFLAKSAANAMGAKIDIRNRQDEGGAVASLLWKVRYKVEEGKLKVPKRLTLPSFK